MVSVTTLSGSWTTTGKPTSVQPPGRLAVDWSTKPAAEFGHEMRKVLPVAIRARNGGPVTTPPGTIATLSSNTVWSPVAGCAKVKRAVLPAAVKDALFA